MSLLGGNVNAFITQFVPATAGSAYEFLVSLAKATAATSPPISLSVGFYDASFTFLGYGLITSIPSDRLPDVNDETWLEIYQTTSIAPVRFNTSFGIDQQTCFGGQFSCPCG